MALNYLLTVDTASFSMEKTNKSNLALLASLAVFSLSCLVVGRIDKSNPRLLQIRVSSSILLRSRLNDPA